MAGYGNPLLYLPHGRKYLVPRLARRQILKPLRGGQFKVDAHPVRQKPGALHQFCVRSRYGLDMDVSVEAPLVPQFI